MLCIVDYGSGNIAAISNILENERIEYFVSGNYQELNKAKNYILPGVGAFDPTLKTLVSSDILQALQENVYVQKKPILGICVGMQLLADRSDEGKCDGLGWIAGNVRKIKFNASSTRLILPHMGWNEIKAHTNEPLLEGVDCKKGFYFLHSYYFDAIEEDDVVASVNYGGKLPCIVRRDNIIGAQFHPEKSHSNGVKFLKNFVRLAQC